MKGKDLSTLINATFIALIIEPGTEQISRYPHYWFVIWRQTISCVTHSGSWRAAAGSLLRWHCLPVLSFSCSTKTFTSVTALDEEPWTSFVRIFDYPVLCNWCRRIPLERKDKFQKEKKKSQCLYLTKN